MSSQSEQIEHYILTNLDKHPADIATSICQRFGVTRMTATRYLQKLILEQKVIKSGKTSDTRYYLSNTKNKSIDLKIDPELDEFAVFEKHLDPALKTLPPNQYKILEYACTELINNTKDHSHGKHLHLEIRWHKDAVTVLIQDDGLGIFKKLQNAFHFSTLQEGLLTLTKGKITTDRKNHTGEGVFFSSRSVDRIAIDANGIRYIKDNAADDWFYEKSDIKRGTTILLTVQFNCSRDIKDIFHAYTSEDYEFNKTDILVELAKMGHERYVSRSQAKRILASLDRFSRIVLDFRGIETVGQGFVDEVFRVFKNDHPNIEITYRNANDEVEFMIRRGTS